MFSRRGPDAVTEELVTVLSGEGCHEFKPLFTLVYTKLRARKMVSGGEEMLRLRVYEKLQQLVNQGMVSKVITEGIKEYAGLATLAAPAPFLRSPRPSRYEDGTFRLRPVRTEKTSCPLKTILVRVVRGKTGNRNATGSE